MEPSKTWRERLGGEAAHLAAAGVGEGGRSRLAETRARSRRAGPPSREDRRSERSRWSDAVALAAGALTMSLPLSAAAVPSGIPYVGYLTYDSGAPLDQSVSIGVEMFNAEIGGTSQWGPQALGTVPVVGGYFTVVIGGQGGPDLADALDSGQPLWLQFTINETQLAPRQRVLSVPFARRAESAASASTLGGLSPQAFAQISELPNVALSGSYADLLDVPAGLLEGAGSTGVIPQFATAQTLGDSVITQEDGRVGVDRPAPKAKLHVGGSVGLGMDESECVAELAGALRWTGEVVEVCDGSAWAGLGSAAGGEDPPPPSFSFTSHTFTTCGASGSTPPNLSACQSAYSSAPWAQDTSAYSMTTPGWQRFTIPQSGTYRITATGAAGSARVTTGGAGNGRQVSADFILAQGDALTIVVGQRGASSPWGAGGGGSFVWLGSTKTSSPPLIAAGGGGGGNVSCNSNNCNISAATGLGASGSAGCGNNGFAGGSGGSGGGGIDGYCGGGAGWLSSGAGNNGGSTSTFTATGGGGFGGGGGSEGCGGWCGGGGGGGFSGGGGGGCSSGNSIGGGGGSFVDSAGANPADFGAIHTGEGTVLIQRL